MIRTEIDTSTVGGRIKKLRIEAGMRQDELIALLCMENKATISKYESDQRLPSAEQIVRMAEIFQTTTDYILRGIEPPAESPDPISPDEHKENERSREAKELLSRIERKGLLDTVIAFMNNLLDLAEGCIRKASEE